MHQTSLEKMAEFRRTYLEARRNESLTIVDVGSADYNGSYRPLFQNSTWRYIAVDLAPGANVDVVLRNAYDWRELRSGMADVVISGQTFEHAEYFWVTMLEVARLLKPHGLCCIIAPAAGPEHRYPVDCWRILADGFRALARYAGLQVLHARTDWADLPDFATASAHKWHESILIARKPDEPLLLSLRRRAARAASHWLHPLPRPQALVQVFYTHDGVHRETESLIAGFDVGNWQEITVTLPLNAGASPLRIDFMQTLRHVEISDLRVNTAERDHFAGELDSLTVAGDAVRVAGASHLRLEITGDDPQLYLPALQHVPNQQALRIYLRVRTIE